MKQRTRQMLVRESAELLRQLWAVRNASSFASVKYTAESFEIRIEDLLKQDRLRKSMVKALKVLCVDAKYRRFEELNDQREIDRLHRKIGIYQ